MGGGGPVAAASVGGMADFFRVPNTSLERKITAQIAAPITTTAMGGHIATGTGPPGGCFAELEAVAWVAVGTASSDARTLWLIWTERNVSHTMNC